MLPIIESFPLRLAWQRKCLFRSICWAWLAAGRASPQPVPGLCAPSSHSPASPAHSKAENCCSAQAEIFADCCHEGLGCLKHLRLPINGNQHCSNSTECWVLAAAEKLPAEFFFKKPKQTVSSYQNKFCFNQCSKISVFIHIALLLRAAPDTDLG